MNHLINEYLTISKNNVDISFDLVLIHELVFDE